MLWEAEVAGDALRQQLCIPRPVQQQLTLLLKSQSQLLRVGLLLAAIGIEGSKPSRHLSRSQLVELGQTF